MKITKNTLKQIIKEELEQVKEITQQQLQSLPDEELDQPKNPQKIPAPEAPAQQAKPVAGDPSKMIVGVASSLRSLMPALQQLQKSLEGYIAATQSKTGQAVNLEEQEVDKE
jgi:hypothetical protein